MKRTNEAFKDEVFRRYRTEVHNRRNLRIYATSTFALFLLAGVFAFSVFTGRIPLPAPVASWLERPSPSNSRNALSAYLDDSITALEIVNIGGSHTHTSTYDCTESEITDTINLLTQLSLTPLDGNPAETALLYRIRANLPPAESGELRQLILVFYEGGIVRVNRIQQNSNFPYIEYFQISEADFATLIDYFKEKVGDAVPVTKAPVITAIPVSADPPTA